MKHERLLFLIPVSQASGLEDIRFKTVRVSLPIEFRSPICAVSNGACGGMSQGVQRSPGGGSAFGNGRSIRLQKSLKRASIAEGEVRAGGGGEARSRSGYRRRRLGFLIPIPRGVRIFS